MLSAAIPAAHAKSVTPSENRWRAFVLDMCNTCVHADHMSKMIQVRNVPDSVHRTLKAQAALAGMSLSDFLLAEIRLLAERPTLAGLRERLRHRSQIATAVPAAEAIRRERDAR